MGGIKYLRSFIKSYLENEKIILGALFQRVVEISVSSDILNKTEQEIIKVLDEYVKRCGDRWWYIYLTLTIKRKISKGSTSRCLWLSLLTFTLKTVLKIS